MFYLGMIIFYNDKIVIGILELEISMVVYFYSFADLQKPLQKNLYGTDMWLVTDNTLHLSHI